MDKNKININIECEVESPINKKFRENVSKLPDLGATILNNVNKLIEKRINKNQIESPISFEDVINEEGEHE